MKRLYSELILDHLKTWRQMVFIMGPRQVGKTTLSLAIREGWEDVYYYNWDNQKDRMIITAGPDAVMEDIGLDGLVDVPPVIIFDEIHKYPNWNQELKNQSRLQRMR